MLRNYMAKKKKIQKDKFKKLAQITGEIYRRACEELGYKTHTLLILLNDSEITSDEFQEKKQELDSLYCKYLCELDSEILELVLISHSEGVIMRAPRTLDLVQKELLERAMNEDNKNDNV